MNDAATSLETGLWGLSANSSLLVYSLAWAALLLGLGLCIWLESRHRRFARAARASLRGGPLSAGYAALRGRIEALEQPERPVLELTVTQVPTRFDRKTGKPTAWHEAGRALRGRAFVLVLPSGERVCVEPQDRVELAQLLSSATEGSTAVRTRSASLRHGEEVYVLGELCREVDPSAASEGFRALGKRWVLRAPRGKALVLSTEHLEERHARREGFHGRWAVRFALAGLVLQLGVLGRFNLLLWDGAVTDSQFSATAHEEGHRFLPVGPVESRAWLRVGYFVNGRWTELQQRVQPWLAQRFDAWSLLSSRRTHPGTAVRYAQHAPAVAQLGESPRLYPWQALALIAAVLGGFGAYLRNTRSTRAWYDRPRLDETA